MFRSYLEILVQRAMRHTVQRGLLVVCILQFLIFFAMCESFQVNVYKLNVHVRYNHYSIRLNDSQVIV